MNENLKNLWNTLRNSGYNPPEFEQFVKDMQSEDNLKGAYSTLKKEGYTPPEFDTFKTDMGWKAAAASAVPAKETKPSAPSAPRAYNPTSDPILRNVQQKDKGEEWPGAYMWHPGHRRRQSAG